MSWTVVFCILVLVCLLPISSSSQFQCHSDNECDTGFCCSKKPRYQVLSRRELEIPQPVLDYVSSRCEPYLPLNDSCLYVWKENGACGCAPGLKCKYFPEKDTQLVPHPLYEASGDKRKRMMSYSDPAAHLCSPDDES